MKSQEMLRQLENLKPTADQALAGLKADRHLMLRIEKAAANPVKETPRRVNWTPVLACAMALVLCVGVAIPALRSTKSSGLITTQAAGSTPVINERASLDQRGDSVSIGSRAAAPGYRSLWAEGSGTYPLVGVKGKYYRMMTTPTSVSKSLLGSQIGTVDEYTTEPSLSGTDVLLSNAAAFGTAVYEVKGMGGTFVAAEVDGKLRVFQRVSFNGSALRGSEDLTDTLQISGHIRAMELSDVGTVTDAALCEELFDTLKDNAMYESSNVVSARQSLLIELDNGLTLQLAVKGENFSSCGTWSCPEFFEAFEEAVE